LNHEYTQIRVHSWLIPQEKLSDFFLTSLQFKHAYKARTVAERAFSIFQDYGRNITYQRTLNTLTHLNTLTYAVMNAHVILKATALPIPT